jgi:hypothetical protein
MSQSRSSLSLRSRQTQILDPVAEGKDDTRLSPESEESVSEAGGQSPQSQSSYGMNDKSSAERQDESNTGVSSSSEAQGDSERDADVSSRSQDDHRMLDEAPSPQSQDSFGIENAFLSDDLGVTMTPSFLGVQDQGTEPTQLQQDLMVGRYAPPLPKACIFDGSTSDTNRGLWLRSP